MINNNKTQCFHLREIHFLHAPVSLLTGTGTWNMQVKDNLTVLIVYLFPLKKVYF